MSRHGPSECFRCRPAGRERATDLALAWAGVWSRETGAELALAAAVLQIAGWALVAGRRAGWTWLRAGLFAAVDGALGIVLLLLERLVH
jgi:hypothetical protein